MRNRYRFFATVGIALFLVASAGDLVHKIQSRLAARAQVAAAAPVLPAMLANPAELAFADTLQPGETLSQLIARAHLQSDEADALLSQLREHQDPRRLLPGFAISYRRSYLDGLLRRAELKLDADHTLSIQRGAAGWQSSVEQVPVQTDTVVIAGQVESSLYAALLTAPESEVPAAERQQLADILADRIFAWQIDFSRDLRAGDRFRILYERTVRPDGSARDARVLGVQFTVNGLDYEAYHFAAADGTEDYYDRQGESLRRAFLRAPLEFRRISSAFSTSRFHPVLKKNRPHYGVDYAASSGTPIRAVGDGTVVRAGRAGGYGNVVELRHKRGYSTRYAHLRGFAKGVRAGARVRQGEVIGYVGATGLATGPHLHYEFRENGRAIDPKTVNRISGDPLPGGHREAFDATVRIQLATLDRFAPAVLLADRAEPRRVADD